MLGDAGGVDRESGGEVVRAVQHQVGPADQAGGVFGIEPGLNRLDRHVRVEGGQTPGGDVHLRQGDVAVGVEHLALQVGAVDLVVVHQDQPADSRGGQVERGRGPQAARADDQHRGALQRLLARAAYLAQHQVAGVALDLLVGKTHPP